MPDPFAHDPAVAAPSWVQELHRSGSEAAAAVPFPTAEQEVWRHTDTGRIPFGPYLAVGGDAPDDDTVRAIAARFGEHGGLLLTWGGGARVLDPGAGGVSLSVLDGAEDPGACGDILPASRDLFGALNTAHFRGGALVRFGKEARPGAPVVVVHWAGPSQSVTFPRTLVELAPLAEASVIEVWTGPGAAEGNLVAAVVEIDVAEGARLDHVGVQQVGDSTTWIGNQQARTGRDGRLTSTVAALGAETSRLRTVVELAGEGGSSEMYGVYVATGDRHVDFRTTQHHVAPRCTSDLRFGGAVWDRASSVHSGLIRIEPGAARSDAHQSSRYLLLSEEARAANIPNLEILNHDVRCGHASSGGPPDDDQLYYLEARGIPPAVAERLVVDGFFADVTDRIPVEEVRAHVGGEVQRRLAILREGT